MGGQQCPGGGYYTEAPKHRAVSRNLRLSKGLSPVKQCLHDSVTHKNGRYVGCCWFHPFIQNVYAIFNNNLINLQMSSDFKSTKVISLSLFSTEVSRHMFPCIMFYIFKHFLRHGVPTLEVC